MPVVDESIVEQQWARLTETERAFERLSSSELYRKKTMIDYVRREIRSYQLGPDAQLQQVFSDINREENDNKPVA